MSRTSDRLRVEFKRDDDIRDAGLTTPADIVRYDDILYGDDPAWQRLDVYRPRAAAGRLPVIVSIHGGAWVYGDKELYQHYCMSLAQRGFAVINLPIGWPRNSSIPRRWRTPTRCSAGRFKTRRPTLWTRTASSP